MSYELCPDCGRPLLVDDMPGPDESICFSRELKTREDRRCVKLTRDRLRERLAAVSRIVRRALACGQLEKLEDARRFLDDEPAAPALDTSLMTEEGRRTWEAAAPARPEATTLPAELREHLERNRVCMCAWGDRPGPGHTRSCPRNPSYDVTPQYESEPAGNTGQDCPQCGGKETVLTEVRCERCGSHL